MKINKILDKNTIILDIGDGACVSIHSHCNGECEIQFGGIEDGVILTAPPFNNGALKTNSLIFARYKPTDHCNVPS